VSQLEADFGFLVYALKLPEPEREFCFHPERKWRFDFAWLEQKVAVECEGGHWVGGRHVRGAGFEGDCEKYNEAACLGWVVIRITRTHIRNGSAEDWIVKALALRGPGG
jgi:very-short-patch-repair endonuclease